ncbi:MAG: endonuclease/exonuclease/phosphatase family protein [Candidatus Hydrogenedentes bacterium]|nr:endonuclease/exonuclease/phosphatase family protein [Candidatus Hydrogenedentota bacterium]
MKRASILAVALAIAALPAAAGGPVTVMTYNIHHAEGLDGTVDLDRIARVIRAERPDIICLQEVDVQCRRTGGVDIPGVLAGKLGMNVAFGPCLQFDGGHYGNATLTRFEILHSENMRLPSPQGAESRGCLVTTLDVDGVEVAVLNTHLGLQPPARKEQASAILERLPAGPVILAGDFNETADMPGLQLLLTTFQDSFRWNRGEAQATYGQGAEARRIDFVLVSKDVLVLSSRVVASGDSQVASDHFPYVAQVDAGSPSETAADRGVYDEKDERVLEAVVEGKEE